MGIFDSTLDAVTAGAFSGTVTRCLLQPLDVIKVRMQLQVEEISRGKGSKYTSTVQTFHKILTEEGVIALWKGHVSAQLLSVLYCAVQFPVFESLKENMSNFTAGGVAGVSATIVCLPIDLLRTRIIAQGAEQVVYNGIYDGVKKIYQRDGFRGFFRGLTPSCALIFPQTAVQFHTYHSLKRATSEYGYSTVWNAVSGFAAGVLSKSLVYPLDLTKKRMQVQGFEDARRPFGRLHVCNGFVHSMRTVIQEEGYLGFFKGFVPSTLKAGSVSALIFVFYELGMR